MQLPFIQSEDRVLNQIQTQWRSILNQIIVNRLTQGNFLTGIKLISGTNTINHKLGREISGYLITNMQGSFAQVYSSPSTIPDLTLMLNASAPTIIDLYVF
jgi:hypothetical protein